MSLQAMSWTHYTGYVQAHTYHKVLFLNLVPSLFFTSDSNVLLSFMIQREHLMSHFCPVLPFGLCIFHHFPSYNL